MPGAPGAHCAVCMALRQTLGRFLTFATARQLLFIYHKKNMCSQLRLHRGSDVVTGRIAVFAAPLPPCVHTCRRLRTFFFSRAAATSSLRSLMSSIVPVAAALLKVALTRADQNFSLFTLHRSPHVGVASQLTVWSTSTGVVSPFTPPHEGSSVPPSPPSPFSRPQFAKTSVRGADSGLRKVCVVLACAIGAAARGLPCVHAAGSSRPRL